MSCHHFSIIGIVGRGLPLLCLSLFILQLEFTLNHAILWDCEKTLTAHNLSITFYLCDFQLSNNSAVDYWTIVDDRDRDESNYSYHFNVGGDTRTVPADNAECYDQDVRDEFPGMWPGYCKDINDSGGLCHESDIEPITQPTVGAYQMYRGINKDHRACWRLHDGVTEPTWHVLDKEDPARGLSITYYNGDYGPGCNDNRDFKIIFECTDNIENVPDREEVISETSPCHYEFRIETTHGCPIDCPIINDHVCAGNGVCDYDFTNNYPKCYCYFGWYGSDCTSTDEDIGIIYRDDEEAFVGSLVVIILLMILVIAILGYLYLRLSKLGRGYIDGPKLQAQQQRAQRERVPDDEYEDE